MTKKMMLLINPRAGKGSFRSCLGDVMEVFCKAGWIPTVYLTQGREDATRIAAACGGDYDMVVCLGGDGTLSEVVTGLVSLPEPPPIGYIPMGTANDVATTLGLPKTPTKAAEVIVNGRARAMDVGRFDSHGHFTYIAAFGAFTEVSYETPQEIKQVLGHLAYVMSGVASLGKITPRKVRVEYDGGVVEEELVFGGVTNSTSIAGLVRLDEKLVSLSDGLFEIILVRNPKKPSDMKKLVDDIVWRSYEGGQVMVLHSKRVRFTLEESVAWTKDGESGGLHQELVFENLPAAIRFVL